MRTQGTPPRQAYNAQTAVNDRQIILGIISPCGNSHATMTVNSNSIQSTVSGNGLGA
jgi:hypothetical protein